MGNPTTVIDALGSATYYTWSGDDVTAMVSEDGFVATDFAVNANPHLPAQWLLALPSSQAASSLCPKTGMPGRQKPLRKIPGRPIIGRLARANT